MSRPLREVTIYLVIAFGLALGIATAIPHMGVNSLLSAFAPVTAVLIITFASTPRGKRRELWGSFGLKRSGKRLWPFAVFVPMILAGSAYAAAVLLGVADVDVEVVTSTLHVLLKHRGDIAKADRELRAAAAG